MFSEHLSDIKGLIIDMDGVLWRDSEPIGNLVKNFDQIKSIGLKFVLATNNATRTIAEHQAKLKSFGVEVPNDQILGSGQATGIYLRKKFGAGTRVYVVGQPSLITTMEEFGLEVVSDLQADVDVVVVSFDYNFNYTKLSTASLLVQRGSVLIGTNSDLTLPTPEGLMPGAGVNLRAVELASNQSAIVVGKPEPLLYQMALERLELLPSETLAIGDRFETDIVGAQRAGIPAALVLSGVSTLADVENFHPKPDIIANNLGELIF